VSCPWVPHLQGTRPTAALAAQSKDSKDTTTWEERRLRMCRAYVAWPVSGSLRGIDLLPASSKWATPTVYPTRHAPFNSVGGNEGESRGVFGEHAWKLVFNN